MAERLRKAAVWTALDQVASTASNSLALFTAAHLGGADALTAFSYAFTAYLLVLGIHRALVLDPLLTEPGRGPAGVDRTAAMLAVAVGLVALAVGSVSGALLDRPALLAVALAMPGLLLQDALRYVAFRRRAARLAFLCDATWCVGLLALVALPIRPVPGVAVSAVWGGAGLVAAVAAAVVMKVGPWATREELRRWRRAVGAYGLALATDSAIFAVGQQLVVLAVVELARSDLGVGELRAGQSLVGPLPALFTVLNMLVVPRLAQGDDPRRLLRIMQSVSLAGGLAWLVVLFAGRDLLVSVALADAVPVGLVLLVLLAGQTLAQALVVHRIADLAAHRRARELVTARVLSVVLGAPVAFLYVADPRVEILGVSLLIQALVYAAGVTVLSRRREHAHV